MTRTNLQEILPLIRRVFVPKNCKWAFSNALTLLVITTFLVSPTIGMRYFRSDVLVFILTVIISYYVLSGVTALPRWTSAEASPRQTTAEDFVETLAPWIRLTLQKLSRHGWAKRRAELNLTRKRSRILTEIGLAQENQHGTLVLTQLGRTAADLVARREAGLTSTWRVMHKKA